MQKLIAVNEAVTVAENSSLKVGSPERHKPTDKIKLSLLKNQYQEKH